MNSLATLWTLTLMNLRALPTRVGSSMVIVIGIAGVVAVLVSLLALAEGFEATLRETGRTDRALILRSGSTSEINGNIPLMQFPIITEAPEIKVKDGKPLASMETFVTIKTKAGQSDELLSITMRGVDTNARMVRDEFRITQGRVATKDQYELMAGIGAASRADGLDVGKTIRLRGIEWKVVGLFTTNGSAYESELWVPERLLAGLYNRGDTFSSTLITLKSAEAFESFKNRLESDRRLNVSVQREVTYYESQSSGTTSLIRGVANLLVFIMSVGAIFAALNTMHASVETRRKDIATLRALGFHRVPVVTSVLAEAMLLAAAGGCLGAVLVYLVLNDLAVSTVGGSYAQVSFRFLVTPGLMAQGLQIALALGLVGGALPAIRAATRSIVDGLRS